MDRPQILDLTKKNDLQIFRLLVDSGVRTSDFYSAQIEELQALRSSKGRPKLGNWIHYPWLKRLVHIVCQEDYYILRTARNYPLIKKSTQRKLHDLTIGVAGLSVGSNIVRALVYAGIGKSYRLADPDYLASSNLNRLSGNMLDLGSNKTQIMARHIWELDPYIDIILYDGGITGDNMSSFLTSPTPLNILFDEADDINFKFHLRLAARSAQIMYCMVTDNGHSAELDVARFDISQSEGGMDKVPIVSLQDVTTAYKNSEKIVLSPKEEQDLINSIIGSHGRVPEMKEAGELKLKGKILGWPQLQAVAGVGASMAVYALRDFIEDKLKSGKKVISLSK